MIRIILLVVGLAAGAVYTAVAVRAMYRDVRALRGGEDPDPPLPPMIEPVPGPGETPDV